MKICLSCNQSFQDTGWTCPSCHCYPELKNGFPLLSPETAEGHTELEKEDFQCLYEIEEKSFWFLARNQIIIWALKKFFPQASSFLEVGCGTGFVLNGIADNVVGLSIFGSELSADGLKFAAKRTPSANFMQMDALQMPFDSEFDVIGAFDVIEHIQSDTLALAQIYKSVKSGGGVIITVPQHMVLWSKRDEISNHFRRYSRQELKEKILAAGFTTVFATSFVSVLFPAILVMRSFSAKNKEEAAKELQIAGILGVILKMTMAFEYFLIERGLTFPFGGSLLMVANKD